MIKTKLKEIIILLFFVLIMGLSWGRIVFGQMLPQDIPLEHRDRYNKMNLLLEQEIIEWKPVEYIPMSFCAHHLLASEQMINLTDGSFDLPFLEMLEETGIDCIRLSIYPYNYEKYPQRYENLIAKIREHNLKLMVAYMVGDLPQGAVVSFEEYKKKELDFTEMFIKKHNPDYYAVVTEPITMEKRIKLGQRSSDAEWGQLVEETVNLVKKINPGIKTMAAVNTEPGQLDSAKKFAMVNNLDIVAFQLYGPAGMYKEYKGWIGKGEVVTDAIEYVKSQGKDTWITETWLSIPTSETWNGTKSSNTYFNELFMAALDAKWLKVITYYAQKHDIKGISPFFTGKFISYPSSVIIQQKDNFLREFNANNRTKPFYAYKDVINEIKNNIFSTDTDNSRAVAKYVHTRHSERSPKGEVKNHDAELILRPAKAGPQDDLKGIFQQSHCVRGNEDINNAREKLSQVKIVSLYENITDVDAFGRSLNDAVAQFKETRTDFIFRGFWLWQPAFETPEDIPPEVLKIAETKNFDSVRIINFIKEKGYFYKRLADSIAVIKKEIPGIIFCGAIPAQKVNSIDYNPVTGKLLTREDTWRMGLDPQKWGVNFRGKPLTKKGFQKLFGLTHLWIKKFQTYDWSKMPAYFPDITNPDYQDLLLSWAKKQIDCGADAIWIDMQFSQASMLARITKDVNHPAVKESYEAAAKIVDKIHSYGLEKGRYIYVGSWSMVSLFAYPAPDFDFVTISPLPQEIKSLKLDEKEWEKKFERIKQKFARDIPIFVFIDWASSTKTQLGVFSQYLNKNKQREFLKIADEFFTKKGAVFVYPVHGGWMGGDARMLSYGQFKVYDSLAPEFDTYETIKELAQNKGTVP